MTITEKVIKQLQKSNLTTQDRTALVTAILDKLVAVPIQNVIVLTETSIVINGKELDLEAYLSFKEGCANLKDNFARKVINEQLRYKATELGVHKAQTIDELLFSKAIIWAINEENILLEKLSTL